MQRIERCRHRAELAETKAASGSPAFRAEMAEVRHEWLVLAGEIEAERTVVSDARDTEARAARAGPPGRADPLGLLVLGAAIGAVSVVTLVLPEWIELTFGPDFDGGSGLVEVAVVLVLALPAIAAALWARSRRRFVQRDG